MNRNDQVVLLSLVLSAVSSATSVSKVAAETEVGGSTSATARQLFADGVVKASRGDNVGAIVDYTQALSLDSKFGKAYANRASNRFNVKDYKGAIADLDVALKYFPSMQYLLDLKQRAQNAMASNNSGDGEAAAQQRAKANRMLMQAIVGGGDFADPDTMIFRGAGGGARAPIVNPFAEHPLTSGQSVDLTPGAPRSGPGTTAHDPSTANESNRLAALANSIPAAQQESSPSQAETGTAANASAALTEKEYFARGCKKSQSLDFNGAIADFSETIKLDPKLPDAWANRGLARFHIKDFKGALEDFQQADRLLPNNKQLKELIEQARKAAKG